MPRLNIATLLCLATLCGSALAQDPHQARPGIVNFVEGQASIDGRPLPAYAAGSTSLHANQYIATGSGKAEILLTPGVFVRLGEDTTLQMVVTDSTHTEIRLEQGRADIEANMLTEGNNILVDMKNGQIHLLEHGLYALDGNASTLRVFEGKAAAYPGADLTTDIKATEVKGGHVLSLASAPFKTQRFDKDKAEDALYHWGDQRSAYLGGAGSSMTRRYAGDSGYYPGWSWAGSPYGYTWFGAGSYYPYGDGFYSPFYYGGLYGYGFYGGGLGYYRGGYFGGGFRRGGFHGGGGGHRG